MTAQQPEISVLAGNSNAMVGELLLRARDMRMRIQMIALACTVEEMLEVAQKVPLDVALISATLADGPLSGFCALRRTRTMEVKG